jgi:1-phosphofructokinase/tagatose 6-phosphate kinase
VITCLALSAAVDVTYLVDSFAIGHIHRPTRTLKLPGGKALNVARAVACLGAQSRAVAVLGGHTGQLVADLLSTPRNADLLVAPLTATVPANSTPTTFTTPPAPRTPPVTLDVIPAEGETRTCVTIFSAADGQQTEVYERGEPLEPAVWEAVAASLAQLSAAETDWLVISGSIPDGIDPTALATAVADCRKRGIRIAVDTHGAALEALVESAHPDLVKVNRSEAEALLGAAPGTDLEELARDIRNRGGSLVIVTDGADGALAIDDSGATRVSALPHIGRHPVGSGDTFLAGFLVATEQGLDVRRALEVATACAGANAAEPGAAVFDPREALAAIAR